jgi:hypothetical protein
VYTVMNTNLLGKTLDVISLAIVVTIALGVLVVATTAFAVSDKYRRYGIWHAVTI